MDNIEASGKLSKQISAFIRENYNDFLAYDRIKVYYDCRFDMHIGIEALKNGK